ncbi:MAG: Ig-like domain-containing protein [Coriobacteriia bacterium]|nr:Ig-like domain-containing protein [Coriobacteriia bacterium]
MIGKTKKVKRTRVLLVTLLAVCALLVTPASAQADTPDVFVPYLGDGVDLDKLAKSSSSVFLGSYNHASSITSGASGGAQTHDASARPVLWDIVEADNGNFILLSRYVLDMQTFTSTPNAAPFNYAQSDIAAYLNDTDFSKGFTALEKSSSVLRTQSIQTSLYDKDEIDVVNVGNIAGLSWESSTQAQFYLPWSRMLSDYGTTANRLYYSALGQDEEPNTITNKALTGFDKTASLRSQSAPVAYWTRSAVFDETNPTGFNEALYVDVASAIKSAPAQYAYGLRPLCLLDTSKIVLARKISDAHQGLLEIAADAKMSAGVISGTGNYYATDKQRHAQAEHYKLTLLNDSLKLLGLSTTGGENIGKDGLTTIYAQNSNALEFVATQTGSSEVGYKIVKGAASKREIVGYGTAASTNFVLPLISLDGQSPLSEGSYTVYVWAHKTFAANSDEASEPLSFTLIIDNKAPTTTINPKPTNTWLSKNVDLSLSATDEVSGVAKLNISVNGQDQNVLANTNTSSLSLKTEGTNTVRFWAEDKAGNKEVEQTVSYAIDKTPPISTALPSGTYAPQKLSITASDPTTNSFDKTVSGVEAIYYSINGSASGVYSQALDLSTPGTYRIQYWAKDKAGNKEAAKTATYTIKYPANYVNIKQKEKVLLVGKSFTPTTSTAPANADTTLVWTSSNDKIASVSKTGKIKAHAAGKVIITAKAALSDAQDTIAVTVEDKVTKIAASQQTIHLTQGTTLKVPFVAYAKTDTKLNVLWKSKKYGCATVVKDAKDKVFEAKGSKRVTANKTAYVKIKALKVGKAKITLTSQNGKKLVLSIVVHKKNDKAAVESITIGALPKSLKLKNKSSVFLKTTINPQSATNTVPKWKSSNPQVIKVDQAGRITALKTGKATISVKAGSKSAKVTISVTKWKD